MAMYAMTVTGEWSVNDGQLLFARVACEFAAEGSVAAMAQAHGLLAVLFAPPDEQPPSLWLIGQRPEATLAGVLAIHVRYLEPEDRAPLGFRCLLD
ncbi:MAG TPA: hypothetical protein VIG44_08705 [Thermomicrobiales bacterium]